MMTVFCEKSFSPHQALDSFLLSTYHNFLCGFLSRLDSSASLNLPSSRWDVSYPNKAPALPVHAAKPGSGRAPSPTRHTDPATPALCDTAVGELFC